MITYKEFEQFYYKSFKIFNTERTPNEVGMTIRTVKWINRLSGKESSTKYYLCFCVMVIQEKMIIEYLVTPIICVKICCLS